MSLVSKARVVCVLAVSLLAAASGASAASDAAAEPSLPALTLAGPDVGGARVVKQRFVKPEKPATAAYAREFAEGTRVGSARLLTLDVQTSLYATPTAAAKDLQTFRRLVSTRAGRELFGSLIAAGFTGELKADLKRVAVSAPVSLAAGQSSTHVSVTVVLKELTFTLHFAVVQTDRVVALLLLSPMPRQKLTRAQVRQIAGLQAERLREGFTVQSTAAPAISGTPSPAQTLTASTGDWSGSPSSYSYQWSRCDATATTCTDIAGATAATYTVAPGDTGSVLRATVTGRNSLTTASSVSAVTAPVA